MRLKVRKQNIALSALAGNLLLCAPAIASAVEHSQCIVVEGAQVQQDSPGNLDEMEQTLWKMDEGHRFVRGASRYLAVRLHDSEEGVADTQTFTKITVPLGRKELPPASSITLKEGYFSRGNTGYAHRGDVWKAGPIRLVVTAVHGSTSTASIKGDVFAYNAMRKTEKNFEIEIQCPVARLTFDLLTPWQGGSGEDWQYFYPQMTAVRHSESPR